MGLVALVVAMGALAVVGALLLGQRRPTRPAAASVPATAEVRTLRVVGASLAVGDEDIARRVVETHMDELRECYAKALETKPDLKGEIGLALDLGKAGEVASLLLGGGEPPSADPTLTTCISPRIEAWQFPELKGKHFVYVLGFGT
jgi:hypothetical protein